MADGNNLRSPIAVFALLFAIGLLSTWLLGILDVYIPVSAYLTVWAALSTLAARPMHWISVVCMAIVSVVLLIALYLGPLWYLLGALTNTIALRNIASEIATQAALQTGGICAAFVILLLFRRNRAS